MVVPSTPDVLLVQRTDRTIVWPSALTESSTDWDDRAFLRSTQRDALTNTLNQGSGKNPLSERIPHISFDHTSFNYNFTGLLEWSAVRLQVSRMTSRPQTA